MPAGTELDLEVARARADEEALDDVVLPEIGDARAARSVRDARVRLVGEARDQLERASRERAQLDAAVQVRVRARRAVPVVIDGQRQAIGCVGNDERQGAATARGYFAARRSRIARQSAAVSRITSATGRTASMRPATWPESASAASRSPPK